MVNNDRAITGGDALGCPSISSWGNPTVPPPPLFAHQQDTVEFLLATPRALCFSDAGTGKTRAVIETIRARKHEGRTLIIAPKSILDPAWGNDIRKFAPELTYAIATASNRAQAFAADVSVVITNPDATTWMVNNPGCLDNFMQLVIDESTAFKNPTARRSKILAKLIQHIKYRIALTGTPAPNSILDIWHQVFLIDDGARLGKSYFKFRGISCEIENPYASFKVWTDKPGIKDAVADILGDITIRHKLEECLDIPENNVIEVNYDLCSKTRSAYDELVKTSLLELDIGAIEAVQASVLTSKLSQIASGAAYAEDQVLTFSSDRTDLICELIEEREQCVVAFIWKHQRDALKEAFKRRGISFRTIDGEAKDADRQTAVSEFQQGLVKVILAHPQSAGHGLTLTKGTTTIWASPTYNAEHYEQFNRRIYRATQTQKTTTIHIVANRTIDSDVYAKLISKTVNMHELLSLAKENYEIYK